MKLPRFIIAFTVIATVATATSAVALQKPAIAACSGTGIECVNDTVKSAQSKTGYKTSVPSLGGKITDIMLYVAGGLSVIMITYGGFRYVTSNGDAKQVEGAKSTILYAAIGLIVALLAWGLVKLVLSKL